MQLEQAGTPAILLCTGPFRKMADVIFSSEGVPDLRVVEVDHPLGGIDADDLEQRIDAATELTLQILRDQR